ncbi:hypothetical protein P8452_42712 [Trifolium repens]|nr:hypothetical protein P8452_42712 [Trifolium repens]
MLVGNGKVDGSGVDVLHAQIRAIFYLKFENGNSDQECLNATLQLQYEAVQPLRYAAYKLIVVTDNSSFRQYYYVTELI